MKVGSWEGDFTVGEKPSVVELRVKTRAPSDTIEFVIPAATSRKEDPRELGICFQRLSVVPR